MSVESFHNGRVVLHGGDCREVLARLPENSLDSCCSDPPYHLASIVKRWSGKDGAPPKGQGSLQRHAKGFMGKTWDGGQIAHEPETWAAVMRVLKPGGHLVAFHAPKNWHRQVCAIEDAGFEIRDTILDLFSPSDLVGRFMESLSLDQQQALVRMIEAGDPLGDLFWMFGCGFPKSHNVSKAIDKTLGAAREKVFKPGAPGYQRIAGSTRPWMDDPRHQVDSDVAVTIESQRWQGYGTALKPAYEPIVLARKPLAGTVADCVMTNGTGALNIDGCRVDAECSTGWNGGAGFTTWRKNGCPGLGEEGEVRPVNGRWPANITHDGSAQIETVFPDDSARFFYSAKADGADRLGSKHPTVKPIDLMRWLVRLVTPPGGTVLDPFAGTGTTAQAAFAEGFNAVLIEREEEYRVDIRRRMELMLAGDFEKIGKLVPQADDFGPLFGGL